MDQLKQMLMDRAGISEDQAGKAMDAFKEFAQQNPSELAGMLPGGIGDKLGGLGR